MPNKPKTQHRSIRVSDDKWDLLGQAAKLMDSDRAKVVNQLIDWYLREAGVKLLERPSREQLADAWNAVEEDRAAKAE